MKKKTVINIVVIGIALGVLYFCHLRIDRFQASTNLNRMINNPDIPASLSIVTFALGPLRGVVVDALWWRAIQQQDKGEFFDALQLADWITKLQPTYASVWAFHGWNMAYNIAHNFAAQEERWNWILRAITLLRDEGLSYNPDNTIIRHELARIFYDRIGGKTDPGAEYFKNQWAFLMMTYFDDGDRQELAKLAKGARSIDELKSRPGVDKYAAALASRGVDIFDFEKNPPQPGWYDVDLPTEVMDSAALEIYYAYKRRKIEDELKLDVDRLIFIDEEYGPLDWRLHQAHAIYWAAEDHFEEFMTTGVNYAQIVRQSMMESFYEGKLFYNREKNIITRTNNLEIIEKVHEFVEYLLHHQFSKHVDLMHKTFLESAVTILYSYNNDRLARELYGHYSEDYLKNSPIPYETFIIQNLTKTLSSGASRNTGSLIETALYQSFHWIDIGDADRSNGFFNLATLMWQRHQLKFQDDPAKMLPKFSQILASARSKFADERGMNEVELSSRATKARSTIPRQTTMKSKPEEQHHHDHH